MPVPDGGAAERAARRACRCRPATGAAPRPAARPSASASWPSVTGVASIRCVRPDLTTVANRPASTRKLGDQRLDGGVDVVDEQPGDGDADGRRHGVVGRLRRVDVVVGVDRRRRAPSTASDASTSLTFMFVDVPGPGLEHVDRELVVELAGLDAPGRGADRAGDRRVQPGDVELGVDRCGVALDQRQGVGDADVEGTVGDGEVADRQVGLLPPQRFGRGHGDPP